MSTAMIAITTSSSTSVKARRRAVTRDPDMDSSASKYRRCSRYHNTRRSGSPARGASRRHHTLA
jgi:hypothetical protein